MNRRLSFLIMFALFLAHGCVGDSTFVAGNEDAPATSDIHATVGDGAGADARHDMVAWDVTVPPHTDVEVDLIEVGDAPAPGDATDAASPVPAVDIHAGADTGEPGDAGEDAAGTDAGKDSGGQGQQSDADEDNLDGSDGDSGCTVEDCPNDGLACTSASCGTDGKCKVVLLAGYCVIDSRCIPSGTVAGKCIACVPDVSPNALVVVEDGTSCDDGDLCTSADFCSKGSCAAGGSVSCDDGDPCTADSCEPAAGCTTGEVACEDGNPCTDDGCEALAGCIYPTNAAPCSDGSACTTSDTCSDGTCVGGEPPLCDDGQACTDDTCDAEIGCVHVLGSAPCDDGDACTDGDTCADGSCGGQAVDCDDGLADTLDGCEPTTGCTHTVQFPCCGNGMVDPGEEWDSGPVTGLACDATCGAATVALPFVKPHWGVADVAYLGGGLWFVGWLGWADLPSGLTHGIWLAQVSTQGRLLAGPVKLNQAPVEPRFTPTSENTPYLQIQSGWQHLLATWIDTQWVEGATASAPSKKHHLRARILSGDLDALDWATELDPSINPSAGVGAQALPGGAGWLVCWIHVDLDSKGEQLGSQLECARLGIDDPATPVPVDLTPLSDMSYASLRLTPQLGGGYYLVLGTSGPGSSIVLQRLNDDGALNGSPTTLESVTSPGFRAAALSGDGRLGYALGNSVRVVEGGAITATLTPDPDAAWIQALGPSPHGGFTVVSQQSNPVPNNSDISVVQIPPSLVAKPVQFPYTSKRHDQFRGVVASDGAGTEAIIWTTYEPELGYDIVRIHFTAGECVSTEPCSVGVSSGGVCGFAPRPDGALCAGADSCSPVGTCLSGSCVTSPKPEGASCRSTVPCSPTGTCQSGTCEVTGDAICPVVGACTAGVCSPLGSCEVVSTCCGDGILDAGEDCEPTGELGPYCRPDCRFLPFASEVLATKPKVHGQTVDQAPLVVTADSSFVVAEASGVASTVGPAPGGLAGDNVTSASLVALDAESWLAGWVSGSQTPVAHQVSSLDGSTIATANFWFSFPEASWIGTGSAGAAVATIHRPSDAGTCGSWTDVLEIQRWIPGGEKETLASYSGHMPHYKNVCYQEPFTLKNVASAIDATGAVAWATHLFRAGNLYSERLRAGLAGSPSGPDVEVELQLPVALVPTAWNSYPSGVESRGFGVGIDGFGGAVVYILVNDLHRVYRIDTSIEPTAVTSRDFVEWGMPGTVQYSFASPQLVPGVDDGLIHFVVPIQSRSGIALFYVRLTHELDVEVVAPISRVCQPSSDQAWRVSPAQDGVFWVLTRALCDGSDTVERVMLPFRLP